MQLSLSVSGQVAGLEGKVCITTTNGIATIHLPRMLKRIRQEAPLIQVKVVASNEVRDITRREADMSIRHAQPTQPDLIGKHVANMSAHLYASREFLNRVGRPESPADCSELDFNWPGESANLDADTAFTGHYGY